MALLCSHLTPSYNPLCAHGYVHRQVWFFYFFLISRLQDSREPVLSSHASISVLRYFELNATVSWVKRDAFKWIERESGGGGAIKRK